MVTSIERIMFSYVVRTADSVQSIVGSNFSTVDGQLAIFDGPAPVAVFAPGHWGSVERCAMTPFPAPMKAAA